ncbi:MAG: ATP-binding cassette domain-containing protein [Caldilineaceae bacterium]|nr:ATP-binding cassette domain-containing protein [Caldilineaceae bacterium]
MTNDPTHTTEDRAPARTDMLNSIRFSLRQWQPYRYQGLVIILSLLAYESFRTFFALQLKFMIDSLQVTGQVPDLLTIMSTLAVGFFVALGLRLRGEQLNAQIGVKILNQLRLRMFKQLQRLPQSYYTGRSTSDTLARFSTDLTDVERVITVQLRDSLLNLVLLLLNIPVLFYIDWRLGLVPLLNLILMPRVIGHLLPQSTQAGYRLKTEEAALGGELQETVQAQALIRAFGFETQMLHRFQQQLLKVETMGVRTILLRSLVSLSARSLALFSLIAAVGLAMLLVTNGTISIGDFVAVFNLLVLANSAIDDLNRIILPDLIAATSGIQRIEELLSEQPDVVERSNAIAVPPLQRQIQFQNVAFRYGTTTNQLEDINLTIRVGQTVAIVGPSGSGKSTLLALLMRSRETTTGKIYYDGVEIRRIERASLQQQIGVVLQETYLFKTTIRENIRMAKPTATDDNVESAAKLAEIHSSILQLPDQYETQVGEAGSQLSSGQRQRIAIARAILRDPAILILDEATSALDPSTEAALNITLQHLGTSRTVVTVTHRLSTITHADHIVVINNGRLVEEGTHDLLLNQMGLYAQLWHKQNGFEISDDGRTANVHAGYLAQLPLFSTLDTAVLEAIASRFTAQFTQQGQLVFQQGDVGDHFYLIARGQVEVLVRNAHGTEQKIDTMRDGDYFGETALLHDAPRNATIRTVTDSLLLVLPKQTFLALLDELPSLRVAVDRQIERALENRTRQHVDKDVVPQT